MTDILVILFILVIIFITIIGLIINKVTANFILLIVVLEFLTFGTIIWSINKLLGNTDCAKFKFISEIQCKGIIVKKEKDEQNHQRKTLWVIDDKANQTKIPCTYHRILLYNTVNIGDSISKNEGELNFIINGRKTSLYQFNCLDGDFILFGY